MCESILAAGLFAYNFCCITSFTCLLRLIASYNHTHNSFHVLKQILQDFTGIITSYPIATHFLNLRFQDFKRFQEHIQQLTTPWKTAQL